MDMCGRQKEKGYEEQACSSPEPPDGADPEMVEAGEKTVLACAERLGIRRILTAGTEEILAACRLNTPVMAVKRFMVPEWMEEEE